MIIANNLHVLRGPWSIYHLTLTSLVTVHYKLALAKVVGRPEVSYQLKHVCFIVDVRYMQHTFTAFIAKCKNYDGRHLAPSGHLRLNKPFTTCVTPFILGNSLICSQPVFILTISGLRFLQIFLLEFSINIKNIHISYFPSSDMGKTTINFNKKHLQLCILQ